MKRISIVILAAGCAGLILPPGGPGAGSRTGQFSALAAQSQPPSVARVAADTRKFSVKVPGGHLMGISKYGPGFTYAMSDGTPAPKLVVDPDGAIFLGYNDRESNARVVELDNDLKLKREVLRLPAKRLADFVAVEDSLTLLVTEFDSLRKQNYVDRKHHTAHIESYASRSGRAIFRTRIVGTREYKKEGDQGVDTVFGTFSIAHDPDDDQYATYFSTYRRWDDGITHQSEYLALFDADDGERISDDDGRRPAGFTWNVSHSFRPRFVHDGERYVMATVGDAYPRGFVVQFYPQGKRALPVKVPKAKPGETYQYVPVSTGDLYARNETTWIAFDSAVGRSSNDIALLRVQGDRVGKAIYLTQTPRARERIPRLVPYGRDHLLVLWMTDRGPAKQKWRPDLSKMAVEGVVVDLRGRVASTRPAAFGKPGQYQLRGAARLFRLPDGRAGWVNDANGLADQLELVVFPGPGGVVTDPDDKPEPPPENEGDTVKIDPALNRPLLTAIYDGETTAALDLLKRGADPNAKSGQWTALLYAAYFGRTEIVADLLRRKANASVTVSGWTALRLAEVRGHDAVARMLRPLTKINSRAFGREARPNNPAGPGVRTRNFRIDSGRDPANSRERLRELGQPKR